MVDSHTHLDLCAEPEAELVAAAQQAGVKLMLTIGIDSSSCRAALAAAEAFPQVYAAVGRHPNAAKGFDDADLAELRALAAHRRCVAIGETGLDHYRRGAPHDFCPSISQRGNRMSQRKVPILFNISHSLSFPPHSRVGSSLQP